MYLIEKLKDRKHNQLRSAMKIKNEFRKGEPTFDMISTLTRKRKELRQEINNCLEQKSLYLDTVFP